MNGAKSRGIGVRGTEKDAAERLLRVKLALTDDDMGRVLEDLIEMLHRRALINRDDLPPAALAKLARREDLRRRIRRPEKPSDPPATTAALP